MACFVLSSAVPANAGDLIRRNKVTAALGIRYEGLEERFEIGQKANATIINASKLSPHGLTCRNNDKVVITSTGRNTFSLFHGGSGRTLKFNIDAQGNVALAH